ncbi:hypothetical protein [Clostridium baratii]|uniref:hypothetical protein n=1 Tax=Clostridium baratii TaxID=1561 RepID=UPI0030D08E3C
MNNALEKKDVREFVKIAMQLHSTNPKLFEGYKNRMIGAIEVQKLLKEKEVS